MLNYEKGIASPADTLKSEGSQSPECSHQNSPAGEALYVCLGACRCSLPKLHLSLLREGAMCSWVRGSCSGQLCLLGKVCVFPVSPAAVTGGASICFVGRKVFSALGGFQVQCLEDSLEPAPMCEPCDTQELPFALHTSELSSPQSMTCSLGPAMTHNPRPTTASHCPQESFLILPPLWASAWSVESVLSALHSPFLL